jgi:hypothetical protein
VPREETAVDELHTTADRSQRRGDLFHMLRAEGVGLARQEHPIDTSARECGQIDLRITDVLLLDHVAPTSVRQKRVDVGAAGGSHPGPTPDQIQVPHRRAGLAQRVHSPGLFRESVRELGARRTASHGLADRTDRKGRGRDVDRQGGVDGDSSLLERLEVLTPILLLVHQHEIGSEGPNAVQSRILGPTDDR